MKVLVVDDETVARTAIVELLSIRDEFECDDYDDPRAALDAAQNTSYGLIITDYRMPGIDGIEFIDRIRATGITAPIVMVTAHAEQSLVRAALQKGANALIPKPVRARQLFSIIDRVVAESANI